MGKQGVPELLKILNYNAISLIAFRLGFIHRLNDFASQFHFWLSHLIVYNG